MNRRSNETSVLGRRILTHLKKRSKKRQHLVKMLEKLGNSVNPIDAEDLREDFTTRHGDLWDVLHLLPPAQRKHLHSVLNEVEDGLTELQDTLSDLEDAIADIEL